MKITYVRYGEKKLVARRGWVQERESVTVSAQRLPNLEFIAEDQNGLTWHQMLDDTWRHHHRDRIDVATEVTG